MHHILYRITNKLNQRYYVGMHSTKNPEDGYLGSGRRIKAEVKKYGKENFEKVILEELSSRKALEDREREIVNDEMLADPLCLNLKNGGEGGGKFWGNPNSLLPFRDPEIRKRTAALVAKTKADRMRDPNYAATLSKKLSDSYPKGHKAFLGKKHSEETKQKMRKSKNVGEANSQFGSCWVVKGANPIKIRKEQLDEYIRNGYSRGRK